MISDFLEDQSSLCITFTNAKASSFNRLSLRKLSDTTREPIVYIPGKFYVRSKSRPLTTAMASLLFPDAE